MDIEFGNTNKLNTNQTGWFVGFSNWGKSSDSLSGGLRSIPQGSALSDLCVKWMFHLKGDTRGANKPISEGRTISLLVSANGGFNLDFSLYSEFPVENTESYTLQNQGDFVIWGSNLFHRSTVKFDSTILTIRWNDFDLTID